MDHCLFLIVYWTYKTATGPCRVAIGPHLCRCATKLLTKAPPLGVVWRNTRVELAGALLNLIYNI